MSNIGDKLKQIRKDWDYVKSNYGHVNDFTGSGMEDTFLSSLLLNPSKTTAFDCYRDMLDHVYGHGYEASCTDHKRKTIPLPYYGEDRDERIVKICERWLLPVPELI